MTYTEIDNDSDQLPSVLSSTLDIPPSQFGLRADTLVRVRWVTILSQTATLAFVGIVLGYKMPLIACFFLISMAVILNVFLYFQLRQRRSLRLSSVSASRQLAFDVAQLSGLLFLTGGLQNPFAFFLLVPVLISATSLPKTPTILLGCLVVLVSSALVEFHLPLPWPGEEPNALSLIYVIGLWTSLMTCLIFMGTYAYRVASEARNLSAALTATELVLAREQHLSDLDGMAAAAAHELGTPLATISVVSKELRREVAESSELSADIDLLLSQTKRCREILTKLTSLPSAADGPMVSVRLTDLVKEIAEPHRNFGIDLDIEIHTSVDQTKETPHVLRLPGVLYGLGNLLENAMDFAAARVTITTAWDDEVIILKITDDGPGFSENVISRLGEPYVTSRQAPGAKKTGPIEGGGLGLGIFIAKTLLERSGATLTFANRQHSGSGADITIVWPIEKLSLANNIEP